MNMMSCSNVQLQQDIKTNRSTFPRRRYSSSPSAHNPVPLCSVHAKRVLRAGRERVGRRRLPSDGDIAVIFALLAVAAPELELDVGGADEDFDVEFGAVVFRFQVVPVPVLALHVGGVEDGFDGASKDGCG